MRRIVVAFTIQETEFLAIVSKGKTSSLFKPIRNCQSNTAMPPLFSMVYYLQSLTDSQQKHSRILEKINILVFGSVLIGTVLMFLWRHQDFTDFWAPGSVAQSSTCLATRSESDSRSRGREFDPGSVPYFRRDWSWNNFHGHSPPYHWIIQEGLLSVTSESMFTKYWLTACSSLPRKKCG